MSVSKIRDEDMREIKSVIKSFTADGYSEERLQKVISQANRYENMRPVTGGSCGSRANRIVLVAAEEMLKQVQQDVIRVAHV
jgi:hypothetical protein